MGLTIMLAGAVGVACQKDPLDEFNPKAESIDATPFSLKGTEKRSDGGYVLTWDITTDASRLFRGRDLGFGICVFYERTLSENVTPEKLLYFTIATST